jgi:hypothetical protein
LKKVLTGGLFASRAVILSAIFAERLAIANMTPQKSASSSQLDPRQDSICDAIKAMFFLDLIASNPAQLTYSWPGGTVIFLQ